MKPITYKASHGGHVIITGCGRLGANLANSLSDESKSVLIIDQDNNSFRKLSPSFGGMIITGDATETAVLIEAEIKTASALIAVTDNDNTNIMIAQLAKELFHIEQVVARLYDPERQCVYQEFDIETICPASLSTREINRLLNTPPSARAAV